MADKSFLLVGLSTALWLISFAFQVNCANRVSERHPKAVLTAGQYQDPSQTLTPGKSLEREIKGDEVHSFRVSLVADQYVRLIVHKRGIDLFVNVILPEGSTRKHENPAGPQSPVSVLIKAETPGIYILEIHPIRKWLAPGRYEIQLEGVSAPDASDDKRLAAQQRVVTGRLNEAAGSSDAALTNYEDALTLWRDVGDTYQEANTLHWIAQTYKGLRDFDKAEEYYKRTLGRYGDDRAAIAYTLLDLADAYYAIRDPLESLSHYEEALAAFKENKNRRGQALALTQLGLIQMRQYDWEGARKILEEALDINRSEGDVFEETRVLNALGGVADNQGRPEEALRLYEQARDGFHQLGDSSREGNMYINIGLHHDTWGEWPEAFASYDKALDLLTAGEAAGDDDRGFINSRRASAFYNIGSLYASLGDYALGLEYLQKSLDLRPPNQQGPTLMWFGYTYVLAGQPNKALEYCGRAITVQEQVRDPRIAQTYTVVGMAQNALGNHAEATEYFDKALEIQRNKKTLDLKGQAITLDKRGHAYAGLRQSNKARSDLEAALSHWRIYKDRNGEALTLFHLAGFEGESGNIDLALANAEAAIKLIEPLRENVIGQQLRTSYFADKVDYYELYIDLVMRSRAAENKGSLTAAAFDASERSRARSFLDLVAEADLGSRSAIDPAFAQLIEKRRLLQRSILVKSAQRSQLLLKNSNALDLAALDRDLAYLNTLQDRFEAEIRSLYPRYAALTSSHPQALGTIQQLLDDNTLLLEYALGEKRSYVWAVTPNSISAFELTTRDQIEKMALRVTEALTARNREGKTESLRKKQMRVQDAERDFAEASAKLSQMVLEPVASLIGHKRLVVVADGALQTVPFAALPVPVGSVSVGKVTLSANSSRTLSSGAVPRLVSINPPSLIAEHEIITLPSASVLALQRRELANRKPAPLAVAVLADPVFDLNDARVARATGNGDQNRRDAAATGRAETTLSKQSASTPSPTPWSRVAQSPRMPSASTSEHSELATALRDVGMDGQLVRLSLSRQEAKAIARVVSPSQSFSALDFKASRQTASSPELSKYRIIHFATHGVLDLEHPELSGIVLSMVDEKSQPQDGYLRLHDIYNLNLPAELVVLSACQTGVGKQIKGEGLIALTRGFMYAGARSVVASLWKVDDQATSELMAEFYKQMFMNKLKPAAALRMAQINLSKKKRWQSPYYWAGFFLQGEWN
jgi:CHAT domain-containing protein/Tfp pilus assembly protein PilF